MATEKHDKGDGTGRTASTGESLDGMLDALQGMLERRHVVPPQAHGPGLTPEADPDTGELDELPVLHQVVIPGVAAAKPARRPVPTAPPAPPSATQTLALTLPAYDDLIKRLTSEAEVIIEECLSEALARARKEMKVRIKQHLDIVLPEILDELRQRTNG